MNVVDLRIQLRQRKAFLIPMTPIQTHFRCRPFEQGPGINIPLVSALSIAESYATRRARPRRNNEVWEPVLFIVKSDVRYDVHNDGATATIPVVEALFSQDGVPLEER